MLSSELSLNYAYLSDNQSVEGTTCSRSSGEATRNVPRCESTTKCPSSSPLTTWYSTRPFDPSSTSTASTCNVETHNQITTCSDQPDFKLRTLDMSQEQFIAGLITWLFSMYLYCGRGGGAELVQDEGSCNILDILWELETDTSQSYMDRWMVQDAEGHQKMLDKWYCGVDWNVDGGFYVECWGQSALGVFVLSSVVSNHQQWQMLSSYLYKAPLWNLILRGTL